MATGELPAPAAMPDKSPLEKRRISLALRMFVTILLRLSAGVFASPTPQ